MYTGKTVALFQPSVNLPIDIKLENSIERGPEYTLESVLKKDRGRLSGPLNQLGLIILSARKTAFRLKSISSLKTNESAGIKQAGVAHFLNRSTIIASSCKHDCHKALS